MVDLLVHDEKAKKKYPTREAHIRVGRILKMNETTNLDLCGKYFWTHQNGVTANIDGDNFEVEALNSNRLRIGARMNMGPNGYTGKREGIGGGIKLNWGF